MKTTTTYADAVSSISNMVLCNEIAKIDDDVFFENVCEATLNEDDEDYTEIYQYYITDCSDSDVDYLRSRYDLLFAWCEKLSVWVLLVTHWGTAWSCIPWVDHDEDDNDSEDEDDNSSEESSKEEDND